MYAHSKKKKNYTLKCIMIKNTFFFKNTILQLPTLNYVNVKHLNGSP